MRLRLFGYTLPILWVLLTVLGLPAGVQASPDVDGYVYYPGGSVGVEGAAMTFENLTTGEEADQVYAPGGGRYYAYFPTSAVQGDIVKITALKDGQCGSVQVTIGTARPTPFEVILGTGCNPIPTMNGLGVVALTLFLAAFGAIWMRQRRKAS